jgi:hypothetical protein
MSPDQASVVIPISVLSIAFASFYISIRMAKKRVSSWKRWSAYWFVRSHGLTGVDNRAKLVWMQRLGYNQTNALVLAQYQSQAIFLAVFGGALFMIVASFFLKR